MKLWSKGLGKLTLPFDLKEAENIEPEGDVMKIEGRIESDKVNWPYTVKLKAEDMIRFTKLMATDEKYLRFLARQHGWGLVLKILGGLMKLVVMSPVFISTMLLFDIGRGDSPEKPDKNGSDPDNTSTTGGDS